MSNYPFYDRDLSWLSFNYRVLMEAKDPSVPIIERLRFIAIYSSNLDEFFRVRVAALNRLSEIGKKKIKKKIGFDPKTVLNKIHENVNKQLSDYGNVLEEIIHLLEKDNIFIHRCKIQKRHEVELERYFKTKVLAFLQPQFVTKKKLPFLKNRALYFGIRIEKDGVSKFTVLNIPSDKISRFFYLKDRKGTHYYFLEDIIKNNLSTIFPDYKILECNSFKLNRDADLRIDDEFNGDLVEKIEKQIKKRDLGEPVRFLYDKDFSKDLLNLFCKHYNLTIGDLVLGGKYHNLNDFFQISSSQDKKLEYQPLLPIKNIKIDKCNSIFNAIDNSDQILHFPYQSYDYILQFFNEAAIHPEVKEISVTFYRIARQSFICDALISAAKNGKVVNVFMEVKARFDEENNIIWARRMKEAGVNLHYSMPGLKVHAKVALVRSTKSLGKKLYGFFGTGNLNENTARIYCDHGLLTSHNGMTKELEQVFKYLRKKQNPNSFKHLIVSQFGALERFNNLIDREINSSKSGKKAYIIIKVNNLEEPNLIKKLYEAAEAGVVVKVISRSICCLVPGFSGIEVSRIVDRYLEHARLFYFYNQGKPELYMGSSDWMNRNLHHRIEVSFPIYDQKIKEQLIHILEIQLNDNTKRVLLSPELKNLPIKRVNKSKKINAQLDTYRYIKNVQRILSD